MSEMFLRICALTEDSDQPVHSCSLIKVYIERILDSHCTKTCLYNFDPLKPHFYIVKLGFTGVYIIFLISAQKHRLWVLVRTASPRWFLRVPTIYVLSRNMKNIRIFYLNHFCGVKFSVYLNRRVFVMGTSEHVRSP